MTINEWTREQRYRPYDAWSTDYLDELTQKIQQSTWRMAYHIQPKTGLLNDPNGFSFFDGRWHLFYQAYPFGPVHGLKSWYHLSSTNLIDWHDEGYGILPDHSKDSHGVYSGTAIAIDDQLLLAYTGNVRDENWERTSYQMGAWMNQKQQITKIDQPLIPSPPAGYTMHFRDPQVIRYEDQYLLIIGAQTENEEGRVLVYQSQSLKNWDFLGELHFTDQSLGFMVECPTLIFIDQKPVLIFCPQGMDKSDLSYQNIYPNTYIVGESFDLKTLTITNPSPIQNLDEGFDLYATQAFSAPDGRALSIGWAGLPEIEYPSDSEGWAHSLSLIRELSLNNKQLYQRPINEYQNLRQKSRAFSGELTDLQLLTENKHNTYELTINLSAATQGILYLFADPANKQHLAIHFDTKHGKMVLDRSHTDMPFAQAFGETRNLTLAKNQPLTLQIFVDQSICEIFVNNGEKVLTSRVFPAENADQIFIEGQGGNYEGKLWELRSAL